MRTRCAFKRCRPLWCLLACALFFSAAQAVRFAAVFPKCASTCEPPKRCTLASGKIVCRDGCWENRCPDYQMCVREQCADPGSGCSRAVQCVDLAIGGTLSMDMGDDLQTPSEGRGTRQCSNGNSGACGEFQQCIFRYPGYVCADYCDPKRCPSGFSCQLEPRQCRAPPCAPVAVCIDPNDKTS